MTKFNSIQKTCEICSKPFFTQPARLKNGRGKYCSKICYYESKKGKEAWNKGKPAPWAAGSNNHRWQGGTPRCKECNVPIWRTMTYCKKHANKGERSYIWKGDNVGYYALHSWVARELGKPSKCEHCGVKATGHKIHWANKSRKYKRELSDWVRLCASCHWAYDH